MAVLGGQVTHAISLDLGSAGELRKHARLIEGQRDMGEDTWADLVIHRRLDQTSIKDGSQRNDDILHWRQTGRRAWQPSRTVLLVGGGSHVWPAH